MDTNYDTWVQITIHGYKIRYKGTDHTYCTPVAVAFQWICHLHGCVLQIMEPPLIRSRGNSSELLLYIFLGLGRWGWGLRGAYVVHPTVEHDSGGVTVSCVETWKSHATEISDWKSEMVELWIFTIFSDKPEWMCIDNYPSSNVIIGFVEYLLIMLLSLLGILLDL